MEVSEASEASEAGMTRGAGDRVMALVTHNTQYTTQPPQITIGNFSCSIH
jgi:hypothetical protein